MKIKRHKKFQKNVKFFMKHFDWKAPFHILSDGTFAKAALDNKVNLRDQLPKYFDNPVKLYTTPCCLVETEKLGPELYGALQVLKSFLVFKCPHAEATIPATKCVKVMCSLEHNVQKRRKFKQSSRTDEDSGIGDKVIADQDIIKFIPATQDHLLRKKLRLIPGTPMVYLKGPAPAFERPSITTQDLARDKSVKKMEVLGYQKEILNRMKEEVFGESSSPLPEKKGTKKRKRAGPNPLSVKKSKKSTPIPSTNQNLKNDDATTSQKKKRKRVKIPKHVKAELATIKHRQTTHTVTF